MPKKYKKVNVKPTTNHDKIQIDIPSYLEKEKKGDKMEDIFEGYKKPIIKNTKKRNQNK
jgi:hypothetical protein